MNCNVNTIKNTELFNELASKYGATNALKILVKQEKHEIFKRDNVVNEYFAGFRNEDGSKKSYINTDSNYKELVSKVASWNKINSTSPYRARVTKVINESSSKNLGRSTDKRNDLLGIVLESKAPELNFAVASSTNQFGKIIDVLKAEERSRFTILNKINNRLKYYENAVKENSTDDNLNNLEKYKKLKSRIEAQLSEIENKIITFDKKSDISFVYSLGQSQLDYVQSTLEKEEITLEEIFEVGGVIDTWRDIRTLLFDLDVELDSEISTQLDALSARANSDSISGKWNRLAKNEVKRQVEYSDNTKLKEEDLNLVDDINFWSKYVMDSSRTGNTLVSQITKWLHDATYKANLEFLTYEEQIEKNLKELTKTESDLLWQRDVNGNKNGNLVNELSDYYYGVYKAAYSQLHNALKSSNKITKRKALLKWITWRNKNLNTIDPQLFTPENVESTETKSFKNKLITEYGEDKTNELIQEATAKYKQYQEDLTLYKESLEVEDLTEQEKFDKSITWQTYNSPIIFLEQKEKLYQYRNKYIVDRPKMTINGKDSQYFDDNYAELLKNKGLLQKYNFIKDTIQEMFEYLPEYAKYKVKARQAFIPQLQKDYLQLLMSKDFKGIMTGLTDKAIDSISSEVNDRQDIPIDPNTGLPFKGIPINFIDNIKNDERVEDFEQILKAFTYMALNYKHKSNVEDKVLLANKVFQNTVEKHKKSNEYKDAALSGQNIKEQVQFTINNILYGEKKQDELVGKKIFKSKQEKTYYKTLVEERNKLEEKLYKGEITEEEFKEQVAPLEQEANKLGRSLVYSKVLDKILAYNQAKALGLNLFSAINNYVFGVVSNTIHAAGNVDFSQKDIWKAYGLAMKSSTTLVNKEFDKLSNIVAKFDILSEVVESQYGQVKGFNKTLETLKNAPYLMLKGGDYFIKAQTMCAMMLHKKITDLQGKERTLWEAFNKEGNWNTKEFGENSDWNGNVNSESENKELINFRQSVMQISKKLHGNFDPNSAQMAKKYILGRILGQFRISWMAEGFASRLEDKKYDQLLQRDVEGRYKTMAKLGFGKSLSILAKLATFQGDSAFTNVATKDRKVVEENMRKNLMEIYVYSALMALFLLLKGNDDDEEDGVKQAAINTLYRIMSDTTFYISPSTFTQIIKDPAPIYRVYKDFNRIKTNFVKMTEDDDYEEERFWLSVTNAFPYLNQYNKLTYMAEKDLSSLIDN